MKHNPQSGVTLPHGEPKLFNGSKQEQRAKTKVEVTPRKSCSLRDTSEALRRAYAQAAKDVRSATLAELEELDGLSSDGLAAAH